MDPETLWSERRHHRGRPPAHTREAVVATAVAVADTEGLSALTMRRVATALGSGTMSLYTYVSERDTLLELMIDAVTGEQRLLPPTGDWRADLAAYARAQRDLMRCHPWLPVALTGRRTLGPNALKALDHALALLDSDSESEFAAPPPSERLEAVALITGFVAGHVGRDVAQQQAFAASNARYLAAVMESGAYPHLAAATEKEKQQKTDTDEAFERTLARVISGLGQRPAHPSPRARHPPAPTAKDSPPSPA